MKYFLLVSHDKHADPEYTLFNDLDLALQKAVEEVESCAQYYSEDTDVYEPECNGKDGWWFLSQYEDAFTVTVREVKLCTSF